MSTKACKSKSIGGQPAELSDSPSDSHGESDNSQVEGVKTIATDGLAETDKEVDSLSESSDDEKGSGEAEESVELPVPKPARRSPPSQLQTSSPLVKSTSAVQQVPLPVLQSAELQLPPQQSRPDALWSLPRLRWAQWATIGAPPSVIRILREGVRLELVSALAPYQAAPVAVSQSDRVWLNETELPRSLHCGIFQRLESRPKYCLAASVHTNTKGKRKIVIDCRPINQHLVRRSARFETLQKLRGFIQRDDYLLSFALTSGYHHVGLHPSAQEYLCFQLDGQFYRCTALPFGLTGAARIFTKLMRVVLTHWRRQGWRASMFLDDGVLAFQSEAVAVNASRQVDELFEQLGLTRNAEKSQWVPVHELEYLGMTVNAATMQFSVPSAKKERIRDIAQAMFHRAARNRGLIPVKLVEAFTRIAMSTHIAVKEARLKTRSLFDVMNATKRSTLVRLSRAAETELKWWIRTEFTPAEIYVPCEASTALEFHRGETDERASDLFLD